MSSIPRKTVLTALAGAASVAAHGHISSVTAGGQTFKGFDPTAAPFGPQPDSVTWSNGATDNGFVLSSAVNDPDIICHLDAANAKLSVPVAAGESVELTWNQWLESHKGPVIDYLADCGGDCATVDKTTLKFFKIAEGGQLSLGAGGGQLGRWADDELIDNGLKWTVEIPASIKPGNYVLRHELIALHEGMQDGKAQMYPQCVNLEISGSGTESPAGVAGTALYKASDEGLKYNIYNDEQSPTYKIPGPALFAAGAGSGSGGGGGAGAGNGSGSGSGSGSGTGSGAGNGAGAGNGNQNGNGGNQGSGNGGNQGGNPNQGGSQGGNQGGNGGNQGGNPFQGGNGGFQGGNGGNPFQGGNQGGFQGGNPFQGATNGLQGGNPFQGFGKRHHARHLKV
ncbi:hypothetical protein PG985_007989 [Apiospora marii]|uniref:uncharacterized protein n=1 Tax=Apiospora marii TaxID=335849 RepID=UPI00313195A3